MAPSSQNIASDLSAGLSNIYLKFSFLSSSSQSDPLKSDIETAKCNTRYTNNGFQCIRFIVTVQQPFELKTVKL